MNVKTERKNGILVISPEGRLDAFEAASLGKKLDNLLGEDDIYLVLNLGNVDYLSSGGIRLLLSVHKKLSSKNGELCLSGVRGYLEDVLKMVGMENVFSNYNSADEAVNHILNVENIKRCEKDWRSLPCYHEMGADFHVFHASGKASRLKIVGDLMKVLYARLEPECICQRHFSEAEYSIGLGALGGSINDCMPVMGEMITIGGTMVWLPTDGNDTPDFLIPQKDTGEVLIYAGLNSALEGEFNDIVIVDNIEGEGSITIADLYEAVFNITRQRHIPHGALISIAMLSDLNALFSSGIKISPINKYKPANNGMVMDPENISRWMDINSEPKFAGRTMISFGLGLDLTADLSNLPRSALDNLFYMHPANIGNKKIMLHNHGVVFESMGWDFVLNLDSEIRRIARQGEFIDMRHLLDTTRITRAVAGVSYITDIVPE